MLSLAPIALPALSHAVARVHAPTRVAVPVMETKADLVALAPKLNPLVEFYDPLNLSEMDLWGQGEEATIGWLRHAEIKHGRIAMFAFVGYCVQANGIHWPWALTSSGISFADISATGFPSEQWDALPTVAKLQILGAIGLLEFFGEGGAGTLDKHYMRGGKPGYYPPLKGGDYIPHPVPFNLYDPFGIASKMSDEQKAKGLVAEINNGRLAMIGIIGSSRPARFRIRCLCSMASSHPTLGSLWVRSAQSTTGFHLLMACLRRSIAHNGLPCSEIFGDACCCLG